MLDRLRFFVFLFSNIFTIPILCVVSLIGKRHGYYRNIWCRVHVFFGGIRFEHFNKPDKNATMYIINHRSWADIFLTESIVTKMYKEVNFCWIAKKELMKNPIIRLLTKLFSMISVDRNGKAALLKLIKDVKKPIEEKRPIMIFPEGTRNKGDGILKFKSGAKILAEKFKLKIQPVVYVNSDYVFDTRSIRIRRDKKIKVIFLPSVDTTSEDWFEKLREDMLKVYNQYKDD